MKKDMKFINKPRSFASVYDGYTRMTRDVTDMPFKAVLRAFADEYRGGNATNGSMMKTLDDMNGTKTNNKALDLAGTTGFAFGCFVSVSWTPNDAATDGPKVTIARRGEHKTLYKTMTMDEFCDKIDYITDDKTRLSDILPDTSEADIENAKTTYMGYFEGIENMQFDLQDYDNKFESIFEDIFGEFYPTSVGDVRCTIEEEYENVHMRSAAYPGDNRADDDDGQSSAAVPEPELTTGHGSGRLDDFLVGPQIDEFIPVGYDDFGY